MYMEVIVGHICLALPEIEGNVIIHLYFQTDSHFIGLFPTADYFRLSEGYF